MGQLPSAISGKKYYILDVAWAPNVGRRYHYIASAEDQSLRIFKLNRTSQPVSSNRSSGSSNATTASNTPSTGGNNDTGNNISSNSTHKMVGPVLELDSFQTLSASAWRCQWNI